MGKREDGQTTDLLRWVPILLSVGSIVFAAGVSYALVKTIPKLQDKSADHDVQLAVLKTQMGGVVDTTKETRDLVKAWMEAQKK